MTPVMFAANNCIVQTSTCFSASLHVQMGAWCGWS